jgi:hypothetical protein
MEGHVAKIQDAHQDILPITTDRIVAKERYLRMVKDAKDRLVP